VQISKIDKFETLTTHIKLFDVPNGNKGFWK